MRITNRLRAVRDMEIRYIEDTTYGQMTSLTTRRRIVRGLGPYAAWLPRNEESDEATY